MKQGSFAEALLDPRLGSVGKLKGLDEAIDWGILRPLADSVRNAADGRPPYDGLSMLKALYLQALYDLSDPGLEEALLDRVSFRRFCGFGLDERTPDETTICRWRQDASRQRVMEVAFLEVNRQLEAKGLLVKKGTLLDATIIQAASRRPAQKEGSEARSEQEPEATFTRKNGNSFYGYRLHVGVDEGSGLVRQAILTGAHRNETVVADGLICGDEEAVYADKAYESRIRREGLKARGIKDRIMHRSHKYQKSLPRWQQRRNELIARRRAAVERLFGTLKRVYRYTRARYCAFVMNVADVYRRLTVYNLRRAIALMG
jgi:IS5 family transposase